MRVNISHVRLRNSQFLKWFAEKECSRSPRRRSGMPVLGEPGVTNERDGTAYAEGWVVTAISPKNGQRLVPTPHPEYNEYRHVSHRKIGLQFGKRKQDTGG